MSQEKNQKDKVEVRQCTVEQSRYGPTERNQELWDVMDCEAPYLCSTHNVGELVTTTVTTAQADKWGRSKVLYLTYTDSL